VYREGAEPGAVVPSAGLVRGVWASEAYKLKAQQKPEQSPISHRNRLHRITGLNVAENHGFKTRFLLAKPLSASTGNSSSAKHLSESLMFSVPWSSAS